MSFFRRLWRDVRAPRKTKRVFPVSNMQVPHHEYRSADPHARSFPSTIRKPNASGVTAAANYGIWTAVKYALVELNLHPWQVCLLLRCRLSRQRLGPKLRATASTGCMGRVHPVLPAGAKLAKYEGSGHRLRRGWRDFLGGYRAFGPWREEQLSHPRFVLHKQYKLRG